MRPKESRQTSLSNRLALLACIGTVQFTNALITRVIRFAPPALTILKSSVSFKLRLASAPENEVVVVPAAEQTRLELRTLATDPSRWILIEGEPASAKHRTS